VAARWGAARWTDPGAAAVTEWFGTMLAGPTIPRPATRFPSSKPRTSARRAPAASGTTIRLPISVSRRGRTIPGTSTPRLRPGAGQAILAVLLQPHFQHQPDQSKWAAYASIYFIDSDADGRQDSSEVCRVSGKIDAVRLPKEIYFVERVMQNEKPDIHIIGHWTYPANTTKTMNVVANNVDSVEFFVNGISRGKGRPAGERLSLCLPQHRVRTGTIKAVGYKGGVAVAQHELKTAGAPAAIKLTPHTAPGGMRADGQDVALIDVEVVDADGERCPTDDARVDFTWSSTGRAVSATGPAIWPAVTTPARPTPPTTSTSTPRAASNRVALRSTVLPGSFTVTARREGLKPATIRSTPNRP